MIYIKFISMIIGLICIMISRIKYTKRTQNKQGKSDYETQEKCINYLGITCIVLSIILAALNI